MARKSEGAAPLMKLGLAQYAVVAITIVIVLPIVTWFVIGDVIHDYYVDQVVAPRLQSEFGFEVGAVPVGPGESGSSAWVAITSIAAGSVLERAGIRRGDTGCLGVDTGGIRDIYAALELLCRQGEVEVSLSNAAQGRQPCRTVTIRR